MNEDTAKSTPVIRSSVEDEEQKSFLKRVNSTEIGIFPTLTGSKSNSSNHSSSKKLSTDSLRQKTSPDKESGLKLSNNANGGELDDEDEGGAHDTITSLAGVQMLQKYRRNIASGTRPNSSSLTSLNNNKSSRLEDLFSVEEPLIEDDKESLGSLGSKSLESLSTIYSQDDNERLEEAEFVPPDGGYGWFISLGAFIALFWAAGMIKSYGILFLEILIFFPDASATLASWIPASMTTFALAMAPIASALCQKYNCRYVTLIGSLLCALGISLSSLANGVPFMFVTFGVLTGIGVGLSTTPGIIITARYFNKRRALANMFCLSGAAAGSFILPFAIEELLMLYGFRGATLILGGCMLHICISAALYRPISDHARIQNIRKCHASSEADKIDFESNEQFKTPKTQNPDQSQADLEKVKSKLNNLVAEVDNVSICSSIGSNHHHHHHHHHHNHHHHHHHSNNGDYFFLPSHSHAGHGHRGSFGSLASSLPMALEHNSHLRGSNLASREELYWPEHSPREIKTSEIRSDSANRFTFSKPQTDSVSGEPLTLRQLYLRQLGSQLSLAKSYILGNSQLESGGEEKKRCSMSSRSSILHRGSLIFGVEDMTTDSTGILKDSKNPSNCFINEYRSRRDCTRYSLKRSQSCEHRDNGSTQADARPRYYSEGNDPCRKYKLASPIQKKKIVDEETKSVDFVDKVGPKDMELHKDSGKIKKKNKEKAIVKCKEEPKKGISKYLNVMIVKEPLFIMMAITVMTMSIGVPHVLFFLPAYSRSIGFPHSAGSKLLAICSIADMLGRIVLTLIIDADMVPKHICYGLAILTCGLSVLVLTTTGLQFWAMAAVMSAYGLGSGAWFLMIPLLLADYLGVENIGSSYGMIRLFQAGANLFGPIVAGGLKDWSGSYVPAFILMGCVMVTGSTAAFFQPFFAKFASRKNKCEENNAQECDVKA